MIRLHIWYNVYAWSIVFVIFVPLSHFLFNWEPIIFTIVTPPDEKTIDVYHQERKRPNIIAVSIIFDRMARRVFQHKFLSYLQ